MNDFYDERDDDIGFDFDEATILAREKFGVQFLFPWQRFVIANILDSARLLAVDKNFSEQEDDEIYCRGRQIVLLPTGSGKSMCFLVPSLLLDGATLVFYPLLALMADQKRRMEEAGISCAIFRGGQSQQERERNFSLLENGAKVILANPEVLQSEKLLARLSSFKITHVAIDEAHCVFEWGSSFRPAYLTLPKIIAALGAKIVTAFTATASPPVLEQVGKIIFDSHFHLVQGESDRPNIHYEVKYAFAREKAALECAATYRRPMIIFCGTRDRAEKMARAVSEQFGRDKSRFYHAGMTKEEKLRAEEWFFCSEDGILSATCAYGMGMDKGNIYTVVHLDAPNHLENFCQEAGRAGRKGDDVKSVLIWSYSDTLRYKKALPKSRERLMGEYALAKTCRRQLMLDYLGGEKTVCSGCDVCDASRAGEKIDYRAGDGEIFFSFIQKNRRCFTRERAIKLITDKFNEKKRAVFGTNVWETDDTEEILEQLFLEKRIKICKGFWKNLVDIEKKAKPDAKKNAGFVKSFTLHRLRLALRAVLVQVRGLEPP
jgi:ATP-dependent DNA helicase RecQ